MTTILNRRNVIIISIQLLEMNLQILHLFQIILFFLIELNFTTKLLIIEPSVNSEGNLFLNIFYLYIILNSLDVSFLL